MGNYLIGGFQLAVRNLCHSFSIIIFTYISGLLLSAQELPKEESAAAITELEMKDELKNEFELTGQFAIIGNYIFYDDFRDHQQFHLIPELNYHFPLSQIFTLDLLLSPKVYGYLKFEEEERKLAVEPYRAWLRFSGDMFEVRVGLQKINFGVATLLRPLQWFNNLNPNDSLQQTKGVYALLFRYYFLNNANLWLWTMFFNAEKRGLDVYKSEPKHPEAGLRFQFPVGELPGEVGLSFHYRQVDPLSVSSLFNSRPISEVRGGLDMKWDVVVGLWMEVASVHKLEDLGNYTHITSINLGLDYIFNLGSDRSLNLLTETLLLAYDREPYQFSNPHLESTLRLSYPLSLADTLSLSGSYRWEINQQGGDYAIFLNYDHDFEITKLYLSWFYQKKKILLTTSEIGLNINLVVVL